ncbi:MAG: hypothetical protein ABSD98_19035 [Candidatus Korobacteraceae bacterium]|jgi:hypothetical protein
MSLLASVILVHSPEGIGIGESDIWWHLLNARYLLQFHVFPSVDTYSFTAAGAHWLDHEWLSEIAFLLSFRTAGLQGILGLYSAIMVLIFTGVYYRSCRAGANCKNAAVVTAGAICLGCVSLAPRMLLFGWLCMVGLLLVLDRFRHTGKGLWLLPPLFALWINLHGSWVFGMIVLMLTIVSGLVEGEWGLVVATRWNQVEWKKLLLASAASLAALFANPFGYRLVFYPFDLLFRQQDVMRYISYWQPVDFSTPRGKQVLILIFAILAAALFSRHRWRLDEVLLMAFALWAALAHMRFLDFAALSIAPILAPSLKLFPPYQRELDKPWLNAGIIAAVVGLLIFFFPSAAKLQQQVNEEYPTAALEFMQQRHLNGRIFNTNEFGSYMEWNAPALKPFIDGREDIFVYKGIFDDYLSAVLVRRSFEVLDKYKIDYVFLEPKTPLGYLLEYSPAWRMIYSDKVAVLFERTPATAAAAGPLKVRSN